MKKINIITKESTIGEVVREYPEVVDTLMGFGVHCVGCHVSEFESLGEGFSGHGMNEEEIKEAIIKLNEVVKKHQSEQKTGEYLSFTEMAIKKVKELCNNDETKALRISVEKGGCAGFSYGFSLASKAANEDKTMDISGARVFVEKEALEKMEGSTIDYIDALQGGGFKVHNPKATKHCGCGTSFS
ncbi:iron-sulfur cluster assembly accessory protein [Candidatus Woesearchaeota archaeon]|nr:iron-sulfur cluster assembly accessory protein [Candidatus Woesearchaeota archaeon]